MCVCVCVCVCACVRVCQQIKMLATIDHAMWFHAPFRADEWLLYEMESTKLVSARGFITGRIYKRDGTLVASVAQEGVVRVQLEDGYVPPLLSKL